MIEIKETKNPNTRTLRISIKGHAGAADIGQDIVCAAASILLYTAAQTAKNLEAAGKLTKAPTINIREGRGGVSLTAKKDYYDEADYAFGIVMVGLGLLAYNYPDYVVIK